MLKNCIFVILHQTETNPMSFLLQSPNNQESKPPTRRSIGRYITLGISLLMIGFLVYTFSEIVAYVIVSWVLSLLGKPIVHFFQRYLRLERFNWGINVSALLTIICFFIIFIGVLLLFIPLVVQEARALANVDYTALGESLKQPIAQFNQWLSEMGVQTDNRPPEEILRDTIAKAFTWGSVGAIFGSSVTAIANIIVGIFSTIFITFFFLRDQDLFLNVLTSLVPERYDDQVRNALDDSTILLTRYFGGLVLQVTCITVYVSIFLSILGIKNAILIGFFAGIMNLIPYLGPTFGGGLGVLISVSANLDADFSTVLLPMILKVLGVFVTVQWLDNYFLSPTIFSKSVMAHPLEIFIIVLVGAQINGILGMVLAIPAYTVLRVIAREFLSRFRFVQKLTERMEEEMIQADEERAEAREEAKLEAMEHKGEEKVDGEK